MALEALEYVPANGVAVAYAGFVGDAFSRRLVYCDSGLQMNFETCKFTGVLSHYCLFGV